MSYYKTKQRRYRSGLTLIVEHERKRIMKEMKVKVQSNDRLMKSPDMFADDVMQLFSVRTGDRAGYEYKGIQSGEFCFDFPADQPEEEIKPEEIKDENQLTLFE